MYKIMCVSEYIFNKEYIRNKGIYTNIKTSTFSKTPELKDKCSNLICQFYFYFY